MLIGSLIPEEADEDTYHHSSALTFAIPKTQTVKCEMRAIVSLLFIM